MRVGSIAHLQLRPDTEKTATVLLACSSALPDSQIYPFKGKGVNHHTHKEIAELFKKPSAVFRRCLIQSAN